MFQLYKSKLLRQSKMDDFPSDGGDNDDDDGTHGISPKLVATDEGTPSETDIHLAAGAEGTEVVPLEAVPPPPLTPPPPEGKTATAPFYPSSPALSPSSSIFCRTLQDATELGHILRGILAKRAVGASRLITV